MASLIIGGIVAVAALLIGESGARACSPPRPTYKVEGPCSTAMMMAPPRGAFPVNALTPTSLRIAAFEVRRDILSSTPARLLGANELEVARVTPGGFEPVAFDLRSPDGAVYVQTMTLAAPVAGEYLVSWAPAGAHCGALPASPTGFGGLVQRFTLGPPAEPPTRAGALSVQSSQVRTVSLDGGIGSDCRPLTVDARMAVVTLEVRPTDAAVPWWDSVQLALHVDGQVFHGFAPAAPLVDGKVTHILEDACDSSTPSRPRHLRDGRHTAKLVATIANAELPAFETNEVAFEIRCAAPEGDAVGCGLGGAPPTTIFSLVVLLSGAMLASAVRRRRIPWRSPGGPPCSTNAVDPRTVVSRF